MTITLRRSLTLLVGIAALALPLEAQVRPGGQPEAAGVITGSVLEDETGRPLEAAAVEVRGGPQAALITGAMTGAGGRFRIEGLRPGSYTVRITFIGYASGERQVEVTPEARVADLGEVRLATSAVALGDVTVEAERGALSLSIDRTVFNARDLPASAGGSASDVLQNVPAVEVDADGRVSVRGNQNVVVQINGRPTPMRGDALAQFLRQLPASMLESVEVVANPSAKHDPEGMGGIVNLVLKQNAELGASGGINLGFGTNGRRNGSANAGYQGGPLTLLATYGFHQDERGNTGFNFRENRYLDPVTFLDQHFEGVFEMTGHNFNLSSDLRLSPRDVISSSLLFNSFEGENAMTNEYHVLDSGRERTGRYDRTTDMAMDNGMLDGSLAFKRTFEPQRHELSAEVRLNRADDERVNRSTRLPFDPDGDPSMEEESWRSADVDDSRRELTLQTDYTRALGEATRVEAGYKGTLRALENSERITVGEGDGHPTLAGSSAFDYDEDVHAIYGVLTRGFGRVEAQAGLRLERASTEFLLTGVDEPFHNEYTSAFPSASALLKVDEARQLRLGYSRRIQRPNARLLNPFPFSEDPLNRFEGNPRLGPEYTDAVELGYQQQLGRGSLQLTPFFRRTTDAVRRIKTVDDEGVSTTTFLNAATSRSYGTDVTSSYRVGERVSGFVSGSAFRTVTDASNIDAGLGSEGFSWNARASVSLQLTRSLSAQWFHFYRAPMNVEQGRVSSFSMGNFSLRQRFADGKGNVTMRVSDPFDTMRFSFRTSDAQHSQLSERKFNSRALYLSVGYSVGQQPRIRQRGPQPEQQGGGDADVGIQ